MTRVLHVIPNLEHGGAERMLTQLVTYDRSDKPEQRVVTLIGAGPFAAEIEAAGVRIDCLDACRATRMPGAVAALARIIRDWRPHAIQSWLYFADLAALAAAGLAGRRNVRLYWGIRCSDLDLDHYDRPLRWARALCRSLSGQPDRIVANSTAGAESHARLGYRRDKLAVIANGIDTSRFLPDPAAGMRVRGTLGISADRLVAAHLARVDPQKDHGTLIEVATRLPQVTFLAAGRGTEALAGPDNLMRLGDRDDAVSLLNAADVVVSTSAFGEGFPNVVAEAMACAKPVVATDCGDARMIVAAAGRIVPPRDPESASRAISEILELTREERHRMGAAGRARIGTEFSLKSAIARFDQLHRTGTIQGTTGPA